MYGMTDEIQGLDEELSNLKKENDSLKSEIFSLKSPQRHKTSVTEFYGKWLLMNPKCTNSQRKAVENFMAYVEQQNT